jgi:hypothetical protein
LALGLELFINVGIRGLIVGAVLGIDLRMHAGKNLGIGEYTNDKKNSMG